MFQKFFKYFLFFTLFTSFSIANNLFALESKNYDSKQNYDDIGTIGVTYLSNKNSHSYLQLGLQLENKLGSPYKNSNFSILYEVSFLGGFDKAKDNYLVNADIGLRLSAYRNDNLRMYFDIMTGLTYNYLSKISENYLGNNAKLLIGVNYDIFSIEFSTMYINTEIGSIGLSGLGVKIIL